MSWLNVLYEIRDNIKSAQTESQVNVQCEECLKWFSSRKSLSNHKPIHQGRTKCEHCEISQHLDLSEDMLKAIIVFRSM